MLRSPLERALLAATLDPTVAIDSRGTVLAASDSLERLFGWKPEELVGQNVRVLMPEPHRSQHDRYLESYRRTGETHILGRTRQFEVLRKDGSTFICELSVGRAEGPGPGGGPLFVGTFRDVTERLLAERALVEAERRFHALFEQSFQYFGLLATDGTLLEANATALDAAGITRAEAVGRKFWETRWWSVSEDAREQLRDAIARAAGGEVVRFETVHRGRDEDELLVVDFSLKPVHDEHGKVVLLIPEGRDITALKRAQQTETAMLRALARIGESAAVLAHEIKNPITAVNLALRAVADKLGTDHQAVLEDLAARMRRLEQLMRRTLSFARPLQLELASVDAAELLEALLDEQRMQLEQRRVVAALERPGHPVRLECDRTLLREVLTNLVQNAVEALGARERGRLQLSVEAVPDGVRLRVEDDGPGVPPAVRASIFDPFFTTKREGTGIGLALCRKIVEQHGGRIDVSTSTLGGARFDVVLPLSPAPCGAPASGANT